MTIKRMICKILLFAVGACLLCQQWAQAQRIYNKERDEQAQAAEKLAETIRNGAVFEAQLKNLGTLAKKDFETTFLAARLNMNADVLTLTNWTAANQMVCSLEKEIKGARVPAAREIAAEINDIEAEIIKAKESLAKVEAVLKDKAVEPQLASLFNKLGDFSSVIEFVEKIKSLETEDKGKTLSDKEGQLLALSQIKETLKSVREVYDAYKAKIEEYNQLQEQLGEFRLTLQTVALQYLQVEEEHWKNVGAIRARLQLEQGEMLSLISRYKGYVARLNPDDADLQDKKKFCRRVGAAQNQEKSDLPFFRFNQSLAESVKEIAARAQSLERDQQEILKQAKAALQKLKVVGLNGEAETALQQTHKAITDARNHINPEDIAHPFELEYRQVFETVGGELKQAIDDKDVPKLQAALRKVLVLAGGNLELKDGSQISSRDMVGDIAQALYDWAALLGRGRTPTRLAELRYAHELHAYSIRKSAARARAYELMVGVGVQRLALYHRGGIKPELIAELIHAIANLAIPPAILAR